MGRMLLRDDQWDRITELLLGKSSDCGVTARDNRLFPEAVLWIARTGSPWRDFPVHFGHWHRVYMRYNRWSHKGHWVRISSFPRSRVGMHTQLTTLYKSPANGYPV